MDILNTFWRLFCAGKKINTLEQSFLAGLKVRARQLCSLLVLMVTLPSFVRLCVSKPANCVSQETYTYLANKSIWMMTLDTFPQEFTIWKLKYISSRIEFDLRLIWGVFDDIEVNFYWFGKTFIFHLVLKLIWGQFQVFLKIFKVNFYSFFFEKYYLWFFFVKLRQCQIIFFLFSNSFKSIFG